MYAGGSGSGLLRFVRNDGWTRHCEERSDEAIQGRRTPPAAWIALLHRNNACLPPRPKINHSGRAGPIQLQKVGDRPDERVGAVGRRAERLKSRVNAQSWSSS